jgi:cytochrome c
LEKHAAVYVEPIMNIGHPIRDLVEGQDGRIGLLFDGGHIGILEPISAGVNPSEVSNESDLAALVLAPCKGCHPFGDGTTHGIGPDLRGVVGRRIASAPGFAYSNALTKLFGRWTPERLDAFLMDPKSYAPGTTMEVDVLPDSEARRQVIEYLASQK